MRTIKWYHHLFLFFISPEFCIEPYVNGDGEKMIYWIKVKRFRGHGYILDSGYKYL